MSSLWDIEVINKGNDWVDMEVLFGHPDAGAFPEDPNFALQLLTNQAYKYDDSYNKISKCSLGDKIEPDKSFLPDDLVIHVDDVIKNVTVYKAERIPFDESAAHELMNSKVKELGIDEESDEWENKWHDFWREYWADPKNLPVAYYRIKSTDPKWIEHISVGMKFDSAAFSQDGPFIEDNIDLKINIPSDATAQDKLDEFEGSNIPPRESSMNMETIRSLAENSDPLEKQDIEDILNLHKQFLESGGAGGKWNIMQLSGLPMNIYNKDGESGKQIVMRSKAIAKGLDLTDQNISYADLSGVIAEEINFNNSKFDGSMATNAFFAKSSFIGASLVGADFTESDLQGVSFENADLTNADFEICNLMGADFTGAKIKGASFKGANLKDIKR